MSVTPSDLAATLLRRRRLSIAATEERARALRVILSREVKRLGIAGHAWLIGSLAFGSFGRGSDVDIVVEGMPRERIAAAWSSLTAALGTRVDLLRFEDLPPALRERVLTEGHKLDVS